MDYHLSGKSVTRPSGILDPLTKNLASTSPARTVRLGVDENDILYVGLLSLSFWCVRDDGSTQHRGNMLNMTVAIFLLVEFCSAFQKARTFTAGGPLLQWLL
jgi:hypothetical protein